MKRLTMVMRCGDIKAPAEAMHYTLIGDDYSFERMSGAELVKAITGKKVEVTNLGVTEKGLVSTNGAMKNYTLVDPTGALASEPRAVILNRVESEKGLLGYTMYNTSGVLQEINVAQAADLARAGMIANGKIRHTQQGDIVASISGMYPLRTIKMVDATGKDNTISIDIMFIGSAIAGKYNTKYAGVVINGKNAASVTKLYDTLVKANGKLIEKVLEISGTDESGSLGIKRTGTAGFYGVYPINTVFELVEKAGNKISLPMGKLMIACTDYDSNKEEATIVITPDMKPAGHQEGTPKANKALKEYTEKILNKLSGVTISNK